MRVVLLGRSLRGRCKRATLRYPLRQSKIENLCLTSAGDEHIRGLEVAVNNALPVRRIQGVRNLRAQFKQHIQRRGLPPMRCLSVNPSSQLHGDKRPAVKLVDFVDGANARMIQSRSSTSLTAEPLECLRVFSDFQEGTSTPLGALVLGPQRCTPHPYPRRPASRRYGNGTRACRRGDREPSFAQHLRWPLKSSQRRNHNA